MAISNIHDAQLMELALHGHHRSFGSLNVSYAAESLVSMQGYTVPIFRRSECYQCYAVMGSARYGFLHSKDRKMLASIEDTK